MSWMTLAFVLGIGLTATVDGGTVSKQLDKFRKPIKHLYLDFDETISTDALSKFVRNKYCELAGLKVDECNSDTMPKDPMALVDALKKYPNQGEDAVDESLTGVGKEGYVKTDRMEVMTKFINRVRKLLDGNVWIVSTSWYPVDEAQWKNYLKYISDEAGLGFESDHIFAIADPGPGIAADKGSAIEANMKKYHIEFNQALFVDDSAGNIATAKYVCNTLHLSKRMGMDDTDRAYILALANMGHNNESKRKWRRHERKGKHAHDDEWVLDE